MFQAVRKHLDGTLKFVNSPLRVILVVVVLLAIIWVVIILPAGTPNHGAGKTYQRSTEVLHAGPSSSSLRYDGSRDKLCPSTKDIESAAPPSDHDLEEELVVICLGDSITYGNRSHLTARPRRSSALEGSYPAELESILKNERLKNSKRWISVYNFGVSGFMVKPGRRLSVGESPEFGHAKELLDKATSVTHFRNGAAALSYSRDELERNVGRVDVKCSGPSEVTRTTGNESNNKGEAKPNATLKEISNIGGCEDPPTAAPVAHQPSSPKVRRQVLILSMLGTNDAKYGGSTMQEDFIAEYKLLLQKLLPDSLFTGSEAEVVKKRREGKDALISVSLGLLTPIPAFPDPQGNESYFNRVVLRINGHLVATSVRLGVAQVANEIRKSYKLLKSVGVLDIYKEFTKIVLATATHTQSRSDVDSLLEALVVPFPEPTELSECPRLPASLTSEQAFVEFVRERLSPKQVMPYLRDGIHPTRKGHAAMASLIAAHLGCFIK